MITTKLRAGLIRAQTAAAPYPIKLMIRIFRITGASMIVQLLRFTIMRLSMLMTSWTRKSTPMYSSMEGV